MGLVIRRRRVALGHSREWLADQVGVHIRTIGRIECGSNLSTGLLLRILLVLDCELSVDVSDDFGKSDRVQFSVLNEFGSPAWALPLSVVKK